MTVVDVIDLTTPSPPPVTKGDEVKDTPETLLNGPEREKKKRRKKKSRKEDREYDNQSRQDRFSDEDRHRNREKRKRSDGEDQSPRRKKHTRSPTPLPFTIDTAPSDIVEGSIPISLPSNVVDVVAQPVAEPSLLLPAHVVLSLQDSTSSISENPPLSPVSEASGIDFLDDDRVVGAPRYFDDRATHPKTPRSCKRCGDEGHDVKNCPNMICLTCGARNEHNPRSCPILRFCWNCKGKGHLSRDCPRIGDMDQRRIDRSDCERCGSWKHHGTNCPTIWRIYTYLTDAERDTVLADRESKRQLGFDGGGEGYIAHDQWCYNCGECGHLGDDCKIAAHNHDRPDDDSAFGSYNQSSGPFASRSYAMPETQRTPREWEEGELFDDGYGFSAEGNVGRKGREKAKAKAREVQTRLEEDDDEPDWFNRNRAASNGKGKAIQLRGKGDLPPKPSAPTIQFGSNRSGSSKPPWALAGTSSARPPISSRPSLLDRIDLDDRPSSSESWKGRGEKRHKHVQRDDRESRRGDSYRESDNMRRKGYGEREEKRRGDQEVHRHNSTHAEQRQERTGRWRGGYER